MLCARVLQRRLLSSLELFGKVHSDDLRLGVTAVLRRLEDVVLDVPKAGDIVANLVTALVVEGTISEDYLQSTGAAVADFALSPGVAPRAAPNAAATDAATRALVTAGRLLYSRYVDALRHALAGMVEVDDVVDLRL